MSEFRKWRTQLNLEVLRVGRIDVVRWQLFPREVRIEAAENILYYIFFY